MQETRTKIMQAAVLEVEKNGLRVTAKQIAERAGVNELTLYRHFGTKQQLIIAAMQYAIGPAADTRYKPSGDILADLKMLLAHYLQVVDEHPGIFVHMLGATDPALIKAIVLPLQQKIALSLTHCINFYKQRGELDETDTEDLILECMGPLLARAFLSRTIIARPLNVSAYVQRFLHGHASSDRDTKQR